MNTKTILSIAAVSLVLLACRSRENSQPLFPLLPETDSMFTIHTPFWSADGKKIMFFGHVWPQEGYGLYDVNPDGGKARLLMYDSLAKWYPSLSPDGKKIAYLANLIHLLIPYSHVWVMNVDGTDPQDLTPFDGSWRGLQWSPDSRTLVFRGLVEVPEGIYQHIVSANVETGKLTLLTHGGNHNYDPHFTADGRRILYSSSKIMTPHGGKIWAMSVNGGKATPVDVTDVPSATPRPSPVSGELWFALGDGGSDVGDCRINLDTAKLPITSVSSFQIVSNTRVLSNALWSPTGSHIAYLEWTSSRDNDLFIIDAKSLARKGITEGYMVYFYQDGWSRDGKRIVFMADKDMDLNTKCYVYDMDSELLKPITITH